MLWAALLGGGLALLVGGLAATGGAFGHPPDKNLCLKPQTPQAVFCPHNLPVTVMVLLGDDMGWGMTRGLALCNDQHCFNVWPGVAIG